MESRSEKSESEMKLFLIFFPFFFFFFLLVLLEDGVGVEVNFAFEVGELAVEQFDVFIDSGAAFRKELQVEAQGLFNELGRGQHPDKFSLHVLL